MAALKNVGIDKLFEKLIGNEKKKSFAEGVKAAAPIFFAKGENSLADKISPSASKLLRNGSSEGGKIMSEIKKVRKR